MTLRLIDGVSNILRPQGADHRHHHYRATRSSVKIINVEAIVRQEACFLSRQE